MSEYYAVERSGDSLAHYGVRGMKWGVKKARSTGNAAALGRQFRKAEKKLAKLEKRGASGKKYAKRAAKLATGAALAGGLAAAGTAGIGKGLQKLSTLGINGKGLNKFKNVRKAVNEAGKAVEKWGKGTTRTGITRNHNGITQELHLKNGGAARLAAGVAGAGLAGAAGYNAIRAATAKKNRQKAANFKAEMNKAFAGTKYANKAGTSSTSKKKERKYFTKDDFKSAAKNAVLGGALMGPSAVNYSVSKKAANSVSGNKPRHGAKRSKR